MDSWTHVAMTTHCEPHRIAGTLDLFLTRLPGSLAHVQMYIPHMDGIS